MGLWGIFRIQIITRLVTQPLSLPCPIPSLSLSVHYLVFWVKFLITQNLLLGHKHQTDDLQESGLQASAGN